MKAHRRDRDAGTSWWSQASARISGLARTNLLVPVVIVGVGGGLVGAAYLTVLRLMTDHIGPGGHSAVVQVVILVGAGVAVTIITRFLGPSGDVDLLVDNIHVLGGESDAHKVKSLIPSSLVCISSGGGLGPEAPLVQTCGTLGSRLGARFGLDSGNIRVLTITGMAAGFSVLFGAPLGAALFALEILHKRGLQYYEALVPALIGSLAGYGAYVALTGLGLEPVWSLPDVGHLHASDLGWGAVCGLLGAVVALVFIWLATVTRAGLRRVPVALLPPLGGAVLALLWWWSPFALTNGERQVDLVVTGGMTTAALAVAILAKLVGVIITMAGRWKGGFIIPLFFIGIAGGQLIHNLVPSVNVTVIMVAFAVACCVGVTKTPLGSTLVVTQMAGLPLLPMAATAAVISLLLTSRSTMIETQRARVDSKKDQ